MINNKKIILFNGAPGSGKTECVQYLCDQYDCINLDFKDPLITVTKNYFNLTKEEWDYWGERKNKETIIPRIGMSLRDCMINVSEDIMKPIFGKGVFGKMLCERIESENIEDLIVCGDCGFADEVYALLSIFSLDNIYLVRLEREGCSFKNDSRSFIDKSLVREDNYYCINNDKTIDDLYSTLDSMMLLIN